MNTQWDVSVPDSTLAAYVDDALAPLLNGKKDEKPAAAADVKHLAPGEERTRRHTMPSIPSCTELFVSVTTEVRIMPLCMTQAHMFYFQCLKCRDVTELANIRIRGFHVQNPSDADADADL